MLVLLYSNRYLRELSKINCVLSTLQLIIAQSPIVPFSALAISSCTNSESFRRFPLNMAVQNSSESAPSLTTVDVFLKPIVTS